jgi:hypothetical protein
VQKCDNTRRNPSTDSANIGELLQVITENICWNLSELIYSKKNEIDRLETEHVRCETASDQNLVVFGSLSCVSTYCR